MTDVYSHGHHESVLRSHSWRTAQNSAGYLLGYLKPDSTRKTETHAEALSSVSP